MSDGNINIRATMDTKGVTSGARSMSASLSGVIRAVKFLAAAMGVMLSGRLIFDFVKGAMGQFDLMSSSIGGNIQSIKTAFTAMQGALANLGASVLTLLTPYIIIALQWLTQFFNILTAIIGVLFGVKAGLGAVAGGAAGAGKEAKKAAGALAAFDEINVLQKPDAGAGGGGGGGGLPILPPFEIPTELLAQIEEFKKKLLEFLDPAIKAFGRLYEALKRLGKTIWENLKWAWDNILVPLGTWVMQEALPVFLDLLAAGVDLLDKVLIALRPTWQVFWEKFLKPAAEWTGEKIIQALKWLTDRLIELGDWIEANPEKFTTMVNIILLLVVGFYALTAVLPIVVTIGTAVISFLALFGIVITASTLVVGLIVIAIIALVAAIVWMILNWDLVKKKAGEVWTAIKDIWWKAATWWYETVTEPILGYFSDLWTSIQTWCTETWDKLVDAWDGAAVWYKLYITDPIKNYFSTLWTDIKTKAGGAWDDIVLKWSGASDWWKLNVTDKIAGFFTAMWAGITSSGSTAWEKIKEIFSGAGTWFDSLKNTLENAFKNVVNGIIGMINTLIDKVVYGVNALIMQINAALPDWVPIIPGINVKNVYHIPYLASGAVIPPNARFAAILGDQTSGRNIEAPESLIRQIVAEEVGRAQQGAQEITINFAGNLASLVRELRPYIEKENVRIGTSLLRGAPI